MANKLEFFFWRMLGHGWDAMDSHIIWSYVLPPLIQHIEAGSVPNLSSDQVWDHSPCYEGGPSTCKVKVSCPWNVKCVLFYMKMGWIQTPLQTNPWNDICFWNPSRFLCVITNVDRYLTLRIHWLFGFPFTLNIYGYFQATIIFTPKIYVPVYLWKYHVVPLCIIVIIYMILFLYEYYTGAFAAFGALFVPNVLNVCLHSCSHTESTTVSHRCDVMFGPWGWPINWPGTVDSFQLGQLRKTSADELMNDSQPMIDWWIQPWFIIPVSSSFYFQRESAMYEIFQLETISRCCLAQRFLHCELPELNCRSFLWPRLPWWTILLSDWPWLNVLFEFF